MRILVTGASRGIGRAVCERLAADGRFEGGLHIAACGSAHADELDELAAAISGDGVTVTPLTGDLADPAVPARLVDEAVAATGGLDAVVANAGLSRTGNLLGTSLEDWDLVFNVNLRAVWLLCKAAHPALKQSGGAIVTVGSMSGVQPQPGLGPYSVTKSGVIMLTRMMAQEWSGDGIRVNCVSPGMVITPMTAANYEDRDFRARREAMVPAGRIADPARDIAGVVAFLLGPDAGYLAGCNIVADGGVSDSMLRLLPARKT